MRGAGSGRFGGFAFGRSSPPASQSYNWGEHCSRRNLSQNRKKSGCLLHTVCGAGCSVCTDVTEASYLSQPGKETVYFLLLTGVEGLNLTHVPGGGKKE